MSVSVGPNIHFKIVEKLNSPDGPTRWGFVFIWKIGKMLLAMKDTLWLAKVEKLNH
jgi:hypothetical protein